jgi:hypothetical protein
MLGRSLAAHRGCWKLFHETPTMHWSAATLAAGALGAVDSVPPVDALGELAAGVHAVSAMAATAVSAATRRKNMDDSSSRSWTGV